MENTIFWGQNFWWRSNHLAMKNYIKSMLKETKEEKDDTK